MGINAQTSVPKFTAGDTLTAANTNLLSNGIPVFGGTALRDASFGGTGEKVLAEGQYAYLEDTNTTQFYDGAAWQPVSAGGMTLISTTALSGASISLSAIPQTYRHLQLVLRSFIPATDNQSFCVRVNGDSTANRHRAVPTSTAPGGFPFDATLWNTNLIGNSNTTGTGLSIWNVYDYTNTTTRKLANSIIQYTNPTTTTMSVENASYYYNQTTAITSLDLLPSSGNFTSGSVLLYGIS
jgi:hypothetical protein